MLLLSSYIRIERHRKDSKTGLSSEVTGEMTDAQLIYSLQFFLQMHCVASMIAYFWSLFNYQNMYLIYYKSSTMNSYRNVTFYISTEDLISSHYYYSLFTI